VHLDQLIPQPRYQNTYSALKTKYGRTLSEKWVEVTDPGKHVFEDIAIAAWLIELWRDMYAGTDGEAAGEKPSFPGFVDIGCGNGVLTYLLLSEGYRGFGFDARARKTWAIFPRDVRACLRQQVLIPKIFASSSAGGDDPRATQLEDDDDNGEKEEGEGKQEEPEEQKTQKGEEEPEPEPEPPNPHTTHDGIFPRGTFIISNHADELTAWTPLLAHLNKSPFIAIPCCSHDLSGARFRAPTEKPPASTATDPETRLPQQKQQPGEEPQPRSLPLMATTTTTSSPPQAAETGTLRKSSQQTKMPSAYATLCGYVARLAREVGYEVETDTLRIPSTRNACVVGRRRRRCAAGMERGGGEDDERVGDVVRIVERELKRGVGEVAGEWRERAEGLMGKSGSGH
jgi:tRNASer (uridine44-2'-O)-methyltransferase